MNVKTHPGSIACVPGALPGGLARTRFFDGMFLTQADLENEQRYWRIKRRLTNRALGTGVVWGLKVRFDEKRRVFVVSPGYALDCCGNDLIVESTVEISEAELWTRADPSLRAAPPASPDDPRAQGHRHACLALQYVECPEDARQVHRDACGGASDVCEPSRVRETARLILAPPPQRELSPPELFLEELEAWRQSLPEDVREELFPNPITPPGPEPLGPSLPVRVRVAIPGTTASAEITPSTTIGEAVPTPNVSLTGVQTLPAGRRTGVVSLEILPATGWGIFDGEVRDGTRVVERATPPLEMQMYWSLDIAVPTGSPSVTHHFEFNAHQLGLEEMFAARRGRATFRIRGIAIVTPQTDTTVQIDLREVHVITDETTVSEDPDGRRRCWDELIPWGWTVDPANGDDIAKVLVLAASYAFLAEVTHGGGNPSQRLIAVLIYILLWYVLFGANPAANVSETHREELARLLDRLFERWCAGFLYPGPRCSDDHHGVYLGCMEVTPNGSVSSFDVWEGRRYVLLGPLLTHWAGLFGIAPLDVIVGRFAEAICCVAKLPLTVPQLDIGRNNGVSFNLDLGVFKGGLSANFARNSFVGTPSTISENARKKFGGDIKTRQLKVQEALPRMMEAFLRADTRAPSELVVATVPGGGSFGFLAPVAQPVKRAELRDQIVGDLRRGEKRFPSRGREPVADFVVTLAESLPVAAVIDPGAPRASAEVAKRLADAGVHVAELVELGADPALARIAASPEEEKKLRPVVDALHDRAERAVDELVAGTRAAAGEGFSRETLGETGFHDKAHAELKRRFGDHVKPELIASAARRARGPG